MSSNEQGNIVFVKPSGKRFDSKRVLGIIWGGKQGTLPDGAIRNRNTGEPRSSLSKIEVNKGL